MPVFTLLCSFIARSIVREQGGNFPLVFVICLRWATWKTVYFFIERDRRQIYELTFCHSLFVSPVFAYRTTKVLVFLHLFVWFSVSRLPFDNRIYIFTEFKHSNQLCILYSVDDLHSINKSVCAQKNKLAEITVTNW